VQYTATASSGATVTFAVETLPQAFARIPDPPQAGHPLLRGHHLVAGGRRRAGQPHLRARHGRGPVLPLFIVDNSIPCFLSGLTPPAVLGILPGYSRSF